MSFAAEVRAEMGRQQMSPSDLSRTSGISKATVSRKVTREQTDLYLREVGAISSALGVPAWELMRRATDNQKVQVAA